MRCAMTGGNYLPWSWKQLEAGEMPEWPGGGFLSLVPTQLQRLLGQPRAVDWLKKFRAVFVGGGPAWPDLLEAAAAVRVPISPCYGMTETAAMVAALLPEDFLAGARSCGTVLPHARVEIVEDSVVRIGGGSVFRGYYPAWRAEPMFETEDIGQIDSRDHLHIAGRRDAVIVTGGKKVAPEEVEAALRATGRFADVAVVGVPDAEWGQCVVACYPAGNGPAQLDEVRAALSERLAAYKCPKRYAPLSLWPRNAQGKIDRAALARLLAVQI